MLAFILVSLLLSLVTSLFPAIQASPCLAMDANFNLLVFGLDGKDFNVGTQDSWTGNSPATDITTSGRPPFDGANTTCYLSQFFNAVYVLSADASNPTTVFIYDAAAKSWSTQPVTNPAGPPTFNPADYKAILDHDTNVFYALSGGELFFLDMGSLQVANSSALAWVDVGAPSFDTTGYQPVMALAQNHIHFLDVPGLSAGEADIFVIHFSFFQPDAQLYPVSGGSNFPQEHGQAVSFFQSSGVQQEFAYIPDDGSATYVLNVETNTTQALAGPSTKDPSAQYFAGITSLVQLSGTGELSFLPYTQGDDSANKAAQWMAINSISAPVGPANSPSRTTSVIGSDESQTPGVAQGMGPTPSVTPNTGSNVANGATRYLVLNALASMTGALTLAMLLL